MSRDRDSVKPLCQTLFVDGQLLRIQPEAATGGVL